MLAGETPEELRRNVELSHCCLLSCGIAIFYSTRNVWFLADWCATAVYLSAGGRLLLQRISPLPPFFHALNFVETMQ